MTAMTKPARQAAADNYRAAARRLAEAARKADKTNRPTLATELRRQAAWAHRAALAEEQDHVPLGLWDK